MNKIKERMEREKNIISEKINNELENIKITIEKERKDAIFKIQQEVALNKIIIKKNLYPEEYLKDKKKEILNEMVNKEKLYIEHRRKKIIIDFSFEEITIEQEITEYLKIMKGRMPTFEHMHHNHINILKHH